MKCWQLDQDDSLFLPIRLVKSIRTPSLQSIPNVWAKRQSHCQAPRDFYICSEENSDNHVDRHRDVDPEDIWHLVTISKYYLYWYKYCNKCRLLQDKSNFSNKTENKNSDIYNITPHDQNRNKVCSENLHWHFMPCQKSFGRNFSETEEKVLKPNSSSTEVSHKALDLDTSE